MVLQSVKKYMKIIPKGALEIQEATLELKSTFSHQRYIKI